MLKLRLFGNYIKSAVCILCFGMTINAYALSIEPVKANFLKGDYKAAILQGEKIMARAGQSDTVDELYYILGLCYLKDGNYLRASDIFEIILKEIPSSRFKDDAKMGLGDTFFLRGYLDEAGKHYQEILERNPRTELKPQLYYRLSQLYFRKGDARKGKECMDKIPESFPLDERAKIETQLSPAAKPSADIFYSIQVGSFREKKNATNLMNRLKAKGHDAYLEEAKGRKGATTYRVKVGRFSERKDASDLEARLSREGYPTKICP